MMRSLTLVIFIGIMWSVPLPAAPVLQVNDRGEVERIDTQPESVSYQRDHQRMRAQTYDLEQCEYSCPHKGQRKKRRSGYTRRYYRNRPWGFYRFAYPYYYHRPGFYFGVGEGRSHYW